MAVRLLIIIFGLKSVIAKQESFIVGGAYVDSIKDFPHIAALSIIDSYGEDDKDFCGSSILNQRILLTAAHCFDDAVEVTAFVGRLDWKRGKLYRIDRYQQHQQWNLYTVSNDIALVRLKKPLSFGQTVKRVILMKKPPKAEIAELTGWGATDVVDRNQSNLLKHTKLKLWTFKECRKVLTMIPNGTICGGEKKAKNNFAYYGDSGSALLVNKNIIIGIVSFGNQAPARSLGVYTDVSYFYNWILIHSRRLACSP